MAACLLAPVPGNAEVGIYSARQEDLIKPLLERFSAEHGIATRLVTAPADALLERLKHEGDASPADLLITIDAGRLHRAKAAGLLQPVASDVLAQAVPAHYRDPDHQWFGLSLRARVIIAAMDQITDASSMRYESLADPGWRGRICIRSSSNIYNQSLVASMMHANGADATLQWAQGLVANFARPPAGGDRDQILAAAGGLCDVAVANTYYLAIMLRSKDEVQRTAAQKVRVIWPNQRDRGAHVNISGAGVTHASRHKDEAVKLLEYLVGREAQRWYGNANNEYPVRDDMQPAELLQSWGRFKADRMPLDALGQLNAQAVRLMDQAGWK